jgi:hypothetical protein
MLRKTLRTTARKTQARIEPECSGSSYLAGTELLIDI